VVNLNLVRDRKTGKSKGYCFLCYEDQRSTNVAVDNFNGIKVSDWAVCLSSMRPQIAGRTVRVDHVDEYRVPKIDDDTDETIKQIYLEGCAPKPLKVLEPQIDSEDEAEARRKRLKLGEDGLIKLDESENVYFAGHSYDDPFLDDVEVKQIKKARKAARKAERLAQREERQKRKVRIE
jgi:RNA-binding motif X-linked protein 2